MYVHPGNRHGTGRGGITVLSKQLEFQFIPDIWIYWIVTDGKNVLTYSSLCAALSFIKYCGGTLSFKKRRLKNGSYTEDIDG